jgi:hypothetical protein
MIVDQPARLAAAALQHGGYFDCVAVGSTLLSLSPRSFLAHLSSIR